MVVRDRPHVRYYSNGVKSFEGLPGDSDSMKFFGPSGEPITHADWHDYFLRDLGNGQFAERYPYTDGDQVPLAREFSSAPR